MTVTTEAPILTGTWAIDPAHSRLGFVARHAMVTKVRGSFTDFEGTATLDIQDPARSSASVSIVVSSVTTGNEQRDGHLRTNDFFDAATYPTITFTSTGVKALGEGVYDLTGDLTIKGTTKPVTIRFESTGVANDPYGNTRAGFEGSVVVNRRDWDVSFNMALDSGGVMVSEKVTLEFDISAIKQL